MGQPKTPRGKGLSTERANAARRFIEAIVDRSYDGKASLYAKAIGASQPAIADFLARRAGVGLNILEKVADHEAVTIDTVIGRSGMPVSNDLDELEVLLRERLAEVMRQKRHRAPSGFPPSHQRPVDSALPRPPAIPRLPPSGRSK